jgi:hypothetical protein
VPVADVYRRQPEQLLNKIVPWRRFRGGTGEFCGQGDIGADWLSEGDSFVGANKLRVTQNVPAAAQTSKDRTFRPPSAFRRQARLRESSVRRQELQSATRYAQAFHPKRCENPDATADERQR